MQHDVRVFGRDDSGGPGRSIRNVQGGSGREHSGRTFGKTFAAREHRRGSVRVSRMLRHWVPREPDCEKALSLVECAGAVAAGVPLRSCNVGSLLLQVALLCPSSARERTLHDQSIGHAPRNCEGKSWPGARVRCFGIFESRSLLRDNDRIHACPKARAVLGPWRRFSRDGARAVWGIGRTPHTWSNPLRSCAGPCGKPPIAFLRC